MSEHDDEGYVVNGDTYLLKFTDGRFAGMRIEVQPLEVADMIEMSAIERSDGIGGAKWYDIAAKYFLRSLVWWNLQHRDRASGNISPLPRTAEGLARVNLDQFIAIYRAWTAELTGPTEGTDLGKGSPSGGPSLADIPTTEPSFVSQPS